MSQVTPALDVVEISSIWSQVTPQAESIGMVQYSKLRTGIIVHYVSKEEKINIEKENRNAMIPFLISYRLQHLNNLILLWHKGASVLKKET